MKAMLIADSDASVVTLSRCIKPYGFDTIRYRSALKAIENIEEIAPDAVFISTGDFPRHWKTIVQYIRSDTDKESTVIILLINGRFTAEDADKAVHIGVQAILTETLEASNDEQKLKQVFARYRHLGEEGLVYGRDGIEEHAVFLFTNPVNDTIITGKIDSLGQTEIRFKPDAPSSTSDLAPGELLDQCSLKIDGTILSPVCMIKKNTNVMVLEFVALDGKTSKVISAFISGERSAV